MSSWDPQHDLDFVHDNVFEGVWKRYDLPDYRGQVWTIQSYPAFYMMAAFAVFIGFMGSRSWVIVRYTIRQLVGSPTRLPDPANPEPLLSLSQSQAVLAIPPAIVNIVVQRWPNLPKWGRYHARHNNPQAIPNDPAQSLWFGIAALINLVAFTITSIATPALLTDGAFGAPVVRVNKLESCMTADRVSGWLSYVISLPKTDAIFRECFDQVHEDCGSQYYLKSPNIVTRRLEFCPFRNSVCQNDTQPFEISHMDISAFEVGINSPSKLTLNHRLTCAPLIVKEFLLFPSYHPTYSWVSARTTVDKRTASSNFTVLLSTVNGPNTLTNESSGRKMAFDNGPQDVTVLPKHYFRFSVDQNEYQRLIHESLQRDDGQSFMIVNRAGRIFHRGKQNDDPIFSAHEPQVDEDNVTYYLPDYEATALGCVEQHQFCILVPNGNISCTDWSFEAQAQGSSFPFSQEDGLNADTYGNWMIESSAFFTEMTQATGVYQYLALRNKMHPRTPLLRDLPQDMETLSPGGRTWPLEVEMWFRKAVLSAIFRIRTSAKYTVQNWHFLQDPLIERELLENWSTCGRVLFRDANYTNINFIGLCSTLGALGFIFIVSFLVKRLHQAGRFAAHVISHPQESMAKSRLWLTRKSGVVVQKIKTLSSTWYENVKHAAKSLIPTRGATRTHRLWFRNRDSSAGTTTGAGSRGARTNTRRFRWMGHRRGILLDGSSAGDCYLEDLPSRDSQVI